MNNKTTNVKHVADIKSLKNILKNKKFSLVHGVFDVIHIGHKRHFDTAKKLTGTLVVSITSDKFVKKGPGRPFFNEFLRSEMVSSLDSVSYVYINDSETPIELIKQLKPNFYCKGQDYVDFSKDITGNIKKEVEAVKKVGGKIFFTSDIQFSSSKIINNNLNSSKIVSEIKSKVKNISDFKLSVFENLKKIEENSGFDEAAISKKREKVKFFNLGPMNQWQKFLPKDIRLKIEKNFEKEMKELKYL